MTTLNATADLVAATVLLEVAGAPAGAVTITRTDANGATLVRLREGQAPIAGAMTVTDSEPSLVGLVSYALTDAAGATVTDAVTFDGAPATTGAVVRRNLADDPRMTSGGMSWSSAGVAVGGGITAASTYTENDLAATGPVTIAADFIAPPAGALTLSFAIRPTLGGTFVGGVLAEASVNVPAGQTSRYVVTGTLPAGTDGFRVQLVSVNRTDGSARIDRLVMEAGATDGAYFDGDTPDTDRLVYAWEGPVANSASVALEVTGPPPSDAPRVHAVQLPQLATLPDYVTGYAGTREPASTIHDVIGRADPLVITGPVRLRRGRLEFRQRDYAAAAALEAVLAAGVVMLRQADHPGLDLYLVASRIESRPDDLARDGWRWVTTAEYVEVRSPALPLLGTAGWSYADVTAGWTSYAAVRDGFADYSELTVGS